MKNLYLIIILIFIGTVPCKAQLNELTQTEYYGIKINNVTFRSIYDTNADLTKMRVLFGNTLLYEYNNDILITKQFWNDNYTFSFGSDMGNNYFIDFFNVHNSSVSLVVKGITVKLGDDVSVFGNDIVINTHNGDNSVVFTDKLTGSTGLAFKIDKITNKIIEITFNAY